MAERGLAPGATMRAFRGLEEAGMRWWVVAAVVGGLMGCAQNPTQVRETGLKVSIPLKGDYRTAGNCVIRIAEDMQGVTTSAIWEDRARKVEVISKFNAGWPTYGVHTIWVMDVSESGGDSVGSLFLRSAPVGNDVEGLAAQFKTCT